MGAEEGEKKMGEKDDDRIHASSSKHCESITRALAPFLIFYTLARLPYRRLSLDFITGSGCNSTSLRTDSPRLANILHVQHFAESGGG